MPAQYCLEDVSLTESLPEIKATMAEYKLIANRAHPITLPWMFDLIGTKENIERFIREEYLDAADEEDIEDWLCHLQIIS